MTLLFLSINCTAKKDNDIVLVKRYVHGKLERIDSLYLKKSQNKNLISYNYILNKDTLDYSFLKSSKNDSIIYFWGLNCSLVSERVYIVNNHSFKILKYYYDEEDSFDEESSFFYNEKYGFLLGYNNGWSNLIFTMESDKFSKILIDSIINDTTDFYSGKVHLDKSNK